MVQTGKFVAAAAGSEDTSVGCLLHAKYYAW